MNKSTKIKLFIFFLLLTGGWIYAVLYVDVASIGPNNTSVGLATANKWFRDLLFNSPNEYFETVYKATEYLGYFALACCVFMACVGLFQLIKRKSLLKVDREIIFTGILYAATIGLYVLFEKKIINYRPVIMSGETAPEASFPSSHTMLIIVVFGSLIILSSHYLNKKHPNISAIIQALLVCLIVAMVAGRLLCGVHWMTDIVGGIFISASLLALYSIFYVGRPKFYYEEDEEEPKKEEVKKKK